MDFNLHHSFHFADQTYLSILRRDIARLIKNFDFTETETGKINIVINEMATNVVKHAQAAGEILIKAIGGDELVNGIEIICLDTGIGISDVKKMQEDGVSTYGSRGEGLGAIKRIADEFDIYSAKGTGTAVLARIYKAAFKLKQKPQQRPHLHISAIMVAKNHETVCGDNWAIENTSGKWAIMVADGLGHGPDAHIASSQAATSFSRKAGQIPSLVLRSLHEELKKTRGAVVKVLNIDLQENLLTYCGVGNISGKLFTSHEIKNIISYNGIVGHNIPNTLTDHQLPWNHSSLLILHSDGLISRWDLNKIPFISRHDTSLIAAMLYKLFNRKTDDILVLVARSQA